MRRHGNEQPCRKGFFFSLRKSPGDEDYKRHPCQKPVQSQQNNVRIMLILTLLSHYFADFEQVFERSTN